MDTISESEQLSNCVDLERAIAEGKQRFVFSGAYIPWPEKTNTFYSFTGEGSKGVNPVTRVYYPRHWELPYDYEDLMRLIIGGGQALFYLDPQNQRAVRFVEYFLAALHSYQSAGPLWKDRLARHQHLMASPSVPISAEVTPLSTPCVIGTTAGSNIRGYKASEPVVIWSRCWFIEQDIERLVRVLVAPLLSQPHKDKLKPQKKSALKAWVSQIARTLNDDVLLYPNILTRGIKGRIPTLPVSKVDDKLIEHLIRKCAIEVKSLSGSDAWAVQLCRPHKSMFELSGDSFRDCKNVQFDRWEHPIGFMLTFGNGSVGVYDQQMPDVQVTAMLKPYLNISALDHVMNQVELFAHNEGFTWVRFDGDEYNFNQNQALIIGKLWDAWSKGIAKVSSKDLLKDVDSRANKKKMSEIFKAAKNNPKSAWKKVILPAGRGYYRLNRPIQ